LTGDVLYDGLLHDDPVVGFVRHHRFVVFQFVRHRHENGVDVIRLTVVFGRRFEQRHVVLVREFLCDVGRDAGLIRDLVAFVSHYDSRDAAGKVVTVALIHPVRKIIER